MLPLQYHTIAPYLRNDTRLFALSSGINYGLADLHQDHHMEKLDRYISSRQTNVHLYDRLKMLRNIPMYDPTRTRVYQGFNHIDILLKDTHRHHRAIEHRFRKGLTSAYDIMRIADGATRYHMSISRGYERFLIEHFNYLTNEALNRRNIVL